MYFEEKKRDSNCVEVFFFDWILKKKLILKSIRKIYFQNNIVWNALEILMTSCICSRYQLGRENKKRSSQKLTWSGDKMVSTADATVHHVNSWHSKLVIDKRCKRCSCSAGDAEMPKMALMANERGTSIANCSIYCFAPFSYATGVPHQELV